MKNVLFFLLKCLVCLIVAAALAFGSLWYIMRSESGTGISIKPWRTDLSVGGTSADMYMRAKVAIYGLWALNSSETVYFRAYNDSDGNKLSPRCTYRIEGTDPDTRWWSVTAYRDFHFIANDDNRYSYSKTTVQREADNSWVIRASPTKQDKNWLPLGDKDGQMDLSLRCYNPSENFVKNINEAKLPKVIKESCQ